VIRAPRVFASEARKWCALVARIGELHAQRCPVLVGTRSVRASEHLGALLDEAGLAHVVLNARQDEQEATIVARAGEPGRITVATNMAGRGTDITLAPEVPALGGLHVLATELHDARRIDRQLFGRCGRQGDPGTAQAYVSIEDELPALHYPRALRWLLARLLAAERVLPGAIGVAVVAAPQRAAEMRHARIRREVLRTDQRLGDLLAFSGPTE
jgi:preprotein translocase subunit SecA